MGLGKRLARGHTRNAGANFQVVIDGTPVNSPMHVYRGGMSLPGASRAALLIANMLGSLPWDAYRKRPNRRLELLPTPPLLEQPAPPDTRMTTFSSWGLDLVWHGNAIGIIAARSRDGWPTGVAPVPAEQVGVRRVGWEPYESRPPGTVEYKIGTRTYGHDQVIHIKGPCQPGDLRGFGVLEAHMNTLDLAHEQNKQARSLSKHGVPTGVLKSDNPDLTEPEAKSLKAGWLASQTERTVAVLNATTTFEPLSWNPEELELVEARKFSLHEQALIFGLPLSFLGADQSSRTYSNIEQDDLQLVKHSMTGHIARFEQTLTLHFPRDTEVKANLDAVLRADTLTRYQAHAVAITSGFLSVDEVREIEDREPQPAPSPQPVQDPAQEEQ